MHIDIIETSPSLARLEDNWNAVYDADDEAQIFLSWKWLSGWLSSIPGPWFILAAKERDAADLPYVAFFPLRLQTTIEKSDVFGNVRMAGNFGADYTGIVCRPEVEHKVIPAFARDHQADELGAAPSRQCQDIRAAVAAVDGLLSESKFPFDQGRQDHQDRRDRQQSLPLRHAAERLECLSRRAQHQYAAEDPPSAEADRSVERISNNRRHIGDVRAGPQDLAGILGQEMAGPQGGSDRQPDPLQRRHADAQFPVRSGVSADLLARRPARCGAGDPGGAAQADVLVLHDRTRRDLRGTAGGHDPACLQHSPRHRARLCRIRLPAR